MDETVVIASVKGRWCLKIFGLLKLFELRKTIPNLPTPFKVLVYCSKVTAPNKDTCFLDLFWGAHPKLVGVALKDTIQVNGKIIGEFVCDGIEKAVGITRLNYAIPHSDILKAACVPDEEAIKYAAGSTVWAWHIKDAQLYDRPKNLSDFGLTRAPQSWQYIKVKKGD